MEKVSLAFLLDNFRLYLFPTYLWKYKNKLDMSPARRFCRDPTEKRDSAEEIGFKDGFSDLHSSHTRVTILNPNHYYMIIDQCNSKLTTF